MESNISDNRMHGVYDRIIIGAGLYGLYAAEKCGSRGEKVLVLEYDKQPFSRATYINQARVHMGYHYPRSLSTAMKSAGYYRRFHDDFSFAINDHFDQIYATSSRFSWTDANEFVSFCRAAGIRCEEVMPKRYFNPGMCDGAFLTEEDTYDAKALGAYFMEKIASMPNVELICESRISAIRKLTDFYEIDYSSSGSCNQKALSEFVLNATYASTNQVLSCIEESDKSEGIIAKDNIAQNDIEQKNVGTTDFTPFKIKYELCEIILCKASEKLDGIGLTVMDGPFFSIMPFGQTGLHSLTSVTFTPHVTSYDTVPSFSCQKGTDCSPGQLCNCNECHNRPQSAWPYMSHLADKYMKPEYSYTYEKSLFSMKPILKSSEVDDSRPTAIKINSQHPTFVSVLSGKINTVYDLDEFLN